MQDKVLVRLQAGGGCSPERDPGLTLTKLLWDVRQVRGACSLFMSNVNCMMLSLTGSSEVSQQLPLEIKLPGKLRVQRNEMRHPNLLALICFHSAPFAAGICGSWVQSCVCRVFCSMHCRAPAPRGWFAAKEALGSSVEQPGELKALST